MGTATAKQKVELAQEMENGELRFGKQGLLSDFENRQEC